MLDIRHIAKRAFRKEETGNPYIFSKISATIQAGERISLLGASGQGKSTLLRMLALFHTPDEGDMRLEDASFRQIGPMEWRKRICYVAQQAVMLPGSVEDNLSAASRLHQLPYDRALAGRLLEAAGLAELNPGHNARELSGGQMQRIALIRALLLRPAVLLLDEVTASLDAGNTHAMERLLSAWHAEEGTALLWVTHELEQAARASDRVWFMAGGTMLEDAPAEQFFSRPASEAASRFIGLPPSEEEVERV